MPSWTSGLAYVLVFVIAITSGASTVSDGHDCEGDSCVRNEGTPPKVVVCIPTTRRRSGREHAANAIASVREAESRGGRTEIMVLYDETVHKPGGADFYVPRKAHEFDAPCQFLRWRRNLVLDFVHLMEAALEKSDADMLMWLEDDAVLLPNWHEATANASEYCLTALHPCNCHSCRSEWPFEFNGVGMVAGLFSRRALIQVLPAIKDMYKRAPLDELVDIACRSRPEFGPALYHVPPLAEHRGDIAVDTTKGGPLPSVVFLSPSPGATLTLESPDAPFQVTAKVTGMVYDAEYSWSATINGVPTGEPLSLKTESPRREEDCSDDNAVEVGMTLMQLEEGEVEIVLVLMEEESEEKEVVAEQALAFSLAYTHRPEPESEL